MGRRHKLSLTADLNRQPCSSFLREKASLGQLLYSNSVVKIPHTLLGATMAWQDDGEPCSRGSQGCRNGARALPGAEGSTLVPPCWVQSCARAPWGMGRCARTLPRAEQAVPGIPLRGEAAGFGLF